MKKFAICIMALAFVAFYSCKKDDEHQNNSTDTTDTTPADVATAEQIGSFLGTWDLTANDVEIDMTATILGQYGFDSVMMVPEMPMTIRIDLVSDNQVNVSGTLDLIEGETLDISTTGIVKGSGLYIEPMQFEGTFDLPIPQDLLDSVPAEYMTFLSAFINDDNTVTINYRGTLTFEQPTNYPNNGELTVVGSYTMEGESNEVMGMRLIVLNVISSEMQAVGPRNESVNKQSRR